VATLGTATTPLHVQKLLRQTDEIVFCFDGDKAGRGAAWRALENSLAHLQDGKQLKFLFLPEGEDPDTYVRKHGKEAFEALFGKAVPLSKFLLEELAGKVDLAAAEGRARLVHEAKPLLRQVPANALRLQLLRELAEKSRLSPEEVAQLCELGSAAPAREQPVPAKVSRKPITPLAEQVLRLLVSSPELVHTLSVEQQGLLDAPEMAPVIELIQTVKESGVASTSMLFEATRDSQHGELYQEIAARGLTEAADESTAREILRDVLRKLESQRVESELKRLYSSNAPNESERRRIQELSKRQAELKGVGGARPGA